MSDLEQAERDINQSIIIDPDNPWAYRNKGIFYMEKGLLSDAKRLFYQTKTMDPSVKLLEFYLGQTHLLAQNIDSACWYWKISNLKKEAAGMEAFERHCEQG